MWRSIIVGLALICLGLLGYYAVTKRAPQITAALEAAANNAVGAKVAGVDVKVSQRDAVLRGTVASNEDRELLKKTVEALPGFRSVDTSLLMVAPPRVEEPKGPDAPPTIEAPARPATLKVTWDGKTVDASGDLPADLKKDVGALLVSEFPGATVKDQTNAAGTTAAPELATTFKAALRALAKTTNGTLHVTSEDVELTGQVANDEADAAIKKAFDTDLKNLMSTVTVTGPPKVDAEVVDSDAPVAEEADAATAEVVAEADAASPADAEVAAQVPPPPGGPLTNAQCQTAIDQALEGDKRITFAGPTGTLAPEGVTKVEEIWALLQRCPDAKGVILGYHDDLGEPDKMKQRTSIRAFSVHKKLVELGMPKERFTHRGMGQKDFKYPNAGATRVLNQRVEFKIEVQ